MYAQFFCEHWLVVVAVEDSDGGVQQKFFRRGWHWGKMDSRVPVVLGIINSVKVLEGHFQINQHQCKRLVGFYKRAEQFFNLLKEYFNDADLYQGSLPSLDVIVSVLQKGQLLVEKYTKEDWFESMVTSGVNQDSFVAIHVELEACIRSIHEVVKHGFPSSKHSDSVPFMTLETVAPLLSLDEDDRAMLFKGDAEKDKHYMLEKIELVKKKKANLTSGARIRNLLSMEQKSSVIRSLDMASEKIRTAELPTGIAELLPSYLRIESSEIEVLDPIGSGGSADVYKCRWLHRDYAVKIFRADDVVGLRKEVENLIPLRHSNIVLLVGFSIRESDSRPMVVMELLDYDLHSLIHFDAADFLCHANLIPMRIAIDFIYQIATGMAYLHKKKLFHGDLKALNVLVKCHPDGSNSRYELKISDFGVSEKLVLGGKGDDGHLSDYTSFGNANVGTTRWRAPEVFDATGGDLKPYSMKADVYSFSMTCVEILTREVPYCDIPTREVRKHVRAGGRPELPATVPDDLRKLIVRCWDMNPTCRPDFFEICTNMQGLKSSRHLDVEERREPWYFSKVFCWCSKPMD